MASSGELLVETVLWTLEAHPLEGYATLRRTQAPVESLEQLTQENERLVLEMPASHRAWGLIVDMRAAPPRNDSDFERAMRPLRVSVGRKSARVVLLLRSVVGMLQVKRINEEEGATSFVTRDHEEAVRLARGEPG